jgi:hypothetical protein
LLPDPWVQAHPAHPTIIITVTGVIPAVYYQHMHPEGF